MNSEWIIVDSDGSWHGLDTSRAVVLPGTALETTDIEYGGDLTDYLAAGEPVEREGTLVIWEDTKASIALAMRAEGIPQTTIDEVLGTVEDAITNNVYG